MTIVGGELGKRTSSQDKTASRRCGVIPGREQYVPGYRKKLSAFIVISKVHCLIYLVSIHAFGLIHGVFDKKKFNVERWRRTEKVRECLN